MTGFYMECNTVLKWVKYLLPKHDTHHLIHIYTLNTTDA